MDTRERLAAAAAMARMDTTPGEASSAPDADAVASLCRSRWGLSPHLKPHQLQGVAWLIRRYLRGVNVILGDEMGLGKTLQAITLLSYLKFERGSSGPFLILCPLSVIDGWSSEFVQFAPKVKVLKYVGSKDERAVFCKEICEFVNCQPASSWDDPELPFNVLLTTYELAMIDMAFLSRFRWRYAIVDEAQRLKNPSSVLYKTLKSSFMIPRRLLLTGTPVQNNLSELWALLHFCMPSVFNNLEDFLSAFSKVAAAGIDAEGIGQLKLLKSIINVFMLRRTKAALVSNKTLVLPSLSEVTLLASLVPMQKQIYLCILKKELPKIMAKTGTVSQSLQNIIVQLRKACSHPYLFDGVEPEPFEEGEHLVQASGKLMVLDLLLQKLFAEKHKVLVFAQMSRTLDILQDYLEFRCYSYERLDGSVRAEERFASARKFNAGTAKDTAADKDFGGSDSPFVFLLTTRAGGVGLNLTAADTVIFYEQDWNPQADKQALQRAHRIGQTQPVLAIHLVAKNTIDEVILSRAKKKLKLTNDIIGHPDSDHEPDSLSNQNPGDLQSMIIFGLHKLDSTDISRSENEAQTQIECLVSEALKQRNKQVFCASKNDSSLFHEDLEENIYSFEGEDFSMKKRKDEHEPNMSAQEDQRILSTWIQKLGGISDQDLETRQKRKWHLDAGRDMMQESSDAAKKLKAEQRKTAKWETLGYKSRALPDPGEIEDEKISDSHGSNVHFVFGDCTHPSVSSHEAAVILSVIDNSGRWGSGGMFSALDRLSKNVQEAYVSAHAAGDLHVGDLHLLTLNDDVSGAQQLSQSSANDIKLSVGLAVVQSYDHRRKIPRSDISIPALETCLRKVATYAASISASIHMPRISSHPGQDRKEWYTIERLLRKYASLTGVPIFVYYYKRANRDEN